jgi:hypothetical protein
VVVTARFVIREVHVVASVDVLSVDAMEHTFDGISGDRLRVNERAHRILSEFGPARLVAKYSRNP